MNIFISSTDHIRTPPFPNLRLYFGASYIYCFSKYFKNMSLFHHSSFIRLMSIVKYTLHFFFLSYSFCILIDDIIVSVCCPSLQFAHLSSVEICFVYLDRQTTLILELLVFCVHLFSLPICHLGRITS